MKKVIYPMLAGIILTSSAFITSTNVVDYDIKDSHKIQFKSKDPTGVFEEIKGTVKFDENDLAGSKFDLTIPVKSINCGNSMQSKKALTAEWFDESKFPTIRYVSSSIVKAGSDYMVNGKLTIRGITKDKKVPLKVVKQGTDLTFSGSFQVNRIEYKVGKKSEAVPDIMNINYSLPVQKK